MGDVMFTNLLEPLISGYLSSYFLQRQQWSFVPGQRGYEWFELDVHNTKDPELKNGMMDLFFVGEVLADGERCVNFEPEPLKFKAGNIT